MTLRVVVEQGPRVRPKDRRERILNQAVESFCRNGYGNVTMADIAAAVGITAGALYRHYASKDDLLSEAIQRGFSGLDHLVDSGGDDAGSFLDELVDFALDYSQYTILWQRELAHVAPPQRRILRNRLNRLHAQFSDRLGLAHKPEENHLITWGLFGLLCGPARQTKAVDRLQLRTTLRHAARSLLGTELTDSVSPGESGGPQVADGVSPHYELAAGRSSRREALLAAAADLFGRYGYSAVSMADLGAAVGVAGSNVYGYFESKEDLLYATLTRSNEVLQFGLTQALRSSDEPRLALEAAIGSFIDISLQMPYSAEGIVDGLLELPEERRGGLRQAQQDFIADWSWLLGRARPELGEVDIRILTQGVLSLVGTCVRIRSLRLQDQIAHHLKQLVSSVLATQLAPAPLNKDPLTNGPIRKDQR